MSTARQLPLNNQGTGGLKLKIKFSKSKGFFSDFVDEASPEEFSRANERSVSTSGYPRISQSAFPEEQHTASGFQQIPLNGRDHSHQNILGRLKFVQKSLLPQANDSATGSKSVDSSVGKSAVTQSCRQNSTCDPPLAQVRLHSPVLDSDLPSVSQDIPFEEPSKDPGCHKDCRRHLRDGHDPGEAELTGVNYRQMLQDLEFLSSQQDETDSDGDYPHNGQFEQHLTVTGAPAQASEPAMAGRDFRSSSEIGNETREGGRELSETVHNSDEERMSPFDINCSLGFADDDFPFSTSNHKQGSDQECIKSQPRENPLFPWSVVSASEPFPSFATVSARRSHLPIGGELSALTSEKPVDLSTKVTRGNGDNNHSVNPVVAERRLIVVDCRSRRGAGSGYEINNNGNFPHFSGDNTVLNHSSYPDPGNLHCTYQSGGLLNIKTSGLERSQKSSVAVPEHQQDQQEQHQSATTDLLRMLLARKERTPNALRNVCPVTKHISPPASTSHATSISQSVNSSPSAGAVLPQLNRTIDELKKRVSEERPVTDLPRSQAGSTHSVEKTADSETRESSVSKPHPRWCRCAEPEPDVHLEEHEDLAGSAVSLPETCKKCSKKLSKRWKKRMCKQKRASRQSDVWYRCQPPAYIHEAGVKGAANELKKCQLGVSSKLVKQMAIQWCKCQTPVLNDAGPADKEEDNGCDLFSACQKCRKWVSEEREQFAVREDLVREGPCPQPFMEDHNYSQSPFSSQAEPSKLFHGNDPVRSENGRVAQTAQLQKAHGHSHQAQTLLPVQMSNADSHRRIVYVSPPPSRRGKNLYTPLGRETETFLILRGSNEHDRGMGQLNTLARVPPNMTPSVTDTASLIPVPPTDLQIDGVAEPPTDSMFFTSASSGPFAASSDELLSSDATLNLPVEDVEGTASSTRPSPSKATGENDRQATRPPLPPEASEDIFHPCCVVMQKLPDELHARQFSASPVCSKSCRQRFLDFLCGKGKLQQCKRNFRDQKTREEQKANTASVWDNKRDFLQQNSTVDGCEEYQQSELEENRERLLEQGTAPGDADASDSSLGSGFIPLSSLCTNGATSLLISEEGVSVQQPARKPRKQKLLSRLLSEAESDNVVLETATDKPEQRAKESENAAEKKQPGRPDSSVINSDEHRQALPDRPGSNSWMKISKFNVKYYVFQCGNRAFVVPLIKRNRSSRNVKRLDEEDLGYVRAVIGQLLAETDSCARHLEYPGSLQHKGLHGSVTQCSTSEETSSKKSKKAFVAPTLGAEDLDIEGLKSLISDKDFSRLVPQNSRLSKSKYLQQIGEKVHMYLTGGSEEAPDWIKDVAKSIVMKHRRRIQSKRLKPSRDVTIEIDYAEEEEMVDVGEEGTFSPQHSASQGSNPAGYDGPLSAEDSSVPVYEGVDPTNLYHQEFASQADYAFQQTGSYVCEEAYAQEEKKPLLGELMHAAQPVDTSTGHGNSLVSGQQILVPLPQGCDYGQADTAALSGSTSSTSDAISPQQLIPRTSVAERLAERKPLLGELITATVLPVSAASDEHTFDEQHDHSTPLQQCQEQQQSGEFFQPAGQHQRDQQSSAWPLALVKEEPPDEDYSHAWPSGGAREEAGHSAHQRAEEHHAFPFISISTFGQGVVQLEDEAGCAAAGRDQHVDHASSAVVQPVLKVEPAHTQDSTISVPLITCIASGEAASLLGNTGNHRVSSPQEDRAAKMSREEVKSRPHFLPQITSVTFGEAAIHSVENRSGRMNTDDENISASAEELACSSLPDDDCSQDKTRQRKEFCQSSMNDAVTVDGVVGKLVENNTGELFDSVSEKGTKTDREQADNGTEDSTLPQISAVTFGEEAILWEKEGSAADSTEVAQVPHLAAAVSECRPSVPVISSVVYGDSVAHLESEANHEPGQNFGSADWDQAVAFEDDEDCAEDGENFHEEDENGEPDLKPVVGGVREGPLISVPVVCSSENPPVSEAVAEPAVEPPQVHVGPGVDLSIVKQEPQEVEEPSSYPLNLPVYTELSEYGAGPAFDNASFETPLQSDPTASDEVAAAPMILDVRSLAVLVPQAKKSGSAQKLQVASDLSGTPPEAPSVSPRKSMTSKSSRRSRYGHAFGSQRRRKTKAVRLQLSSPEAVQMPEEAGTCGLKENTVHSSDSPLFPPDSGSQSLPLPQPDDHVSPGKGSVPASLGSTDAPSSKPRDYQPKKPVQPDITLGVTKTSSPSSTMALQSKKDPQKAKLPQEGQADCVEHTVAPVCQASVSETLDCYNHTACYDDTRAGTSKNEASSHHVNAESSTLGAIVPRRINTPKPKSKRKVKRRGGSKSRKKAAKPNSSSTVAFRALPAAEMDSSRNTPLKAGSATSYSAPLTPEASDGRESSEMTPKVTRSASKSSAELQSRTTPGKPVRGPEGTPNTGHVILPQVTIGMSKSSVTPSAVTGTWGSGALAVTAAKTPDEKDNASVPSSCTSSARLSAATVPSCSAVSASASLQQSADADDDIPAFKQRGTPAKLQGTELSDTEATSLPGRSPQSAPPKSRQKRRRGRARLTLRKKRLAPPRCPPSASQTTATSKDRTLADASAGSETDREARLDGDPLEEGDCPTPVKRLKEDTVGTSIRSKKEPPAATASQAKPQSLKRKFVSSDSEAKNSVSGKASVVGSERSVISHMSAMLSKIASTSPSSSPVLAGSSKVSTLAVKVVKTGSDGEGLFSRLQASEVSVKEDLVKKDPASGTKTAGAQDIGSNSSKGARERSFFDCLPQDFLDAWKT